METSAIASFLKEEVGAFHKLSAERLQPLAEVSPVGSFEANQAVAHHGAEAVPFGVGLSGTIHVSVAGDGGTRLDGCLALAARQPSQ